MHKLYRLTFSLLAFSLLFIFNACQPKLTASFTTPGHSHYANKSQSSTVQTVEPQTQSIIEKEVREVPVDLDASETSLSEKQIRKIEKRLEKSGVDTEFIQPLTETAQDGDLRERLNEALEGTKYESMNKRELKREIKKDLKQLRSMDEEDAADSDMLLIILLTILIPPLGVALVYGIGTEFWISLILTLLFYIPGLIYSLIVVLR